MYLSSIRGRDRMWIADNETHLRLLADSNNVNHKRISPSLLSSIGVMTARTQSQADLEIGVANLGFYYSKTSFQDPSRLVM